MTSINQSLSKSIGTKAKGLIAGLGMLTSIQLIDACKPNTPEPVKSTVVNYVTVYDKSSCKQVKILQSEYDANIANYSKDACPSVNDSRNEIVIGDGKIDTIKIAIITPDFIDDKLNASLLEKILDNKKAIEERKQYLGKKNPDGSYSPEDIIKFVVDKDFFGKGTYTREDMDYIKTLVENGHKEGNYGKYVASTITNDQIHQKAKEAKDKMDLRFIDQKLKTLRGVIILTSSDLGKIFGGNGSKFGRSGINGFNVVGPGPEFASWSDKMGEYSTRGTIGHERIGHGLTGINSHAKSLNITLPVQAPNSIQNVFLSTTIDSGGGGVAGGTEKGKDIEAFVPSTGQKIIVGKFADDGGLSTMDIRRSSVAKNIKYGPWATNKGGRLATENNIQISEPCPIVIDDIMKFGDPRLKNKKFSAKTYKTLTNAKGK